MEKGFTYPSSKVVLQYLEANQRIALVRRCPSLFHIDLATPISLDYLFFGFTCTTINKVSYQVGVIRHYYEPQKILKCHERNNKDGGVCFDLDEFGCFDKSSNKIVNPGHVPLEAAVDVLPEMTPELSNRIEGEMGERLAELKMLRRIKQRQKEKDSIRSWLNSYEHKKAGTLPPYTMYLQYTKRTEKNGECTNIQTERLKYNQKLYKSMEYLNNFLFKERKIPIRVDRLEFIHSGGVLRVPENLKIKPKGIFTGTNITSILNSVRPLLVHTGRLNEFGVAGGRQLAANYTNPALQSAKSLLLRRIKFSGPLFEILLEFQNEYIDVENGKLRPFEYEQLMEQIIEKKRKVGTKYSFNVQNRDIIKEVFWIVRSFAGITCGKEKKRGCRRFPHVYTYPMDDSSKLSIYCNRNKKHDEKEPYSEPWILCFVVEKIKNFQ